MRFLPYLAVAVLSSAITLAAVGVFRDPPEARPDDDPTFERTAAGASSTPLEAAGPTLRGATSGTTGPVDEQERRFLKDALARERVRAENAKVRDEDDGVTVIGRVLEHQADPAPLLADFDRFQAHVARNAGPTVRHESTGDLTVISGKEKPKDPWVIELGPGRFRFDDVLDYWRHQMDEVQSVEIRGAGMDRTTLFSKDDVVTVKSRLGSLRISDLTFEAARYQLVDSRGDVAIVLENVRIEGTDPDSPAPFYLAGRFYLGCRGCEFRGVYSPARIHGQGIALFEKCTFIDLKTGFWASSGAAVGSRVTLRDCAWHDSPVAGSYLVYRNTPEYVVEVQGGRVLLGRAGMSEDARRKHWGLEWVQAAPAPEFGGSPTSQTIAAMLALLEDAPLPPGLVPTSFRVLASPPSGPVRYLLSAYDPVKKEGKGFEVWRGSGGVELRPTNLHDGHERPVEGSLTLAEALRRCGEPLASPVDKVHYARLWDGKEHGLAIVISWRSYSMLQLHAADARPFKTPWTTEW